MRFNFPLNCKSSTLAQLIRLANSFNIASLFQHCPDELVMLGNHRDAWVFGAADASSGTAAMMELSRVLGEQLKKGIPWRGQSTMLT